MDQREFLRYTGPVTYQRRSPGPPVFLWTPQPDTDRPSVAEAGRARSDKHQINGLKSMQLAFENNTKSFH